MKEIAFNLKSTKNVLKILLGFVVSMITTPLAIVVLALLSLLGFLIFILNAIFEAVGNSFISSVGKLKDLAEKHLPGA